MSKHAPDCTSIVVVFPPFSSRSTRRAHAEWRIPSCTCTVRRMTGRTWYVEDGTFRT
jgi:hypothetical protein